MGLEAELSTLRSERDVATEGKTKAEAIAADLQNQLTTQAESLQKAQASQDLQFTQLMGVEAELTKLKGQRESLLTGIQRIRFACG
jgi:chromosome segregation ATPase